MKTIAPLFSLGLPNTSALHVVFVLFDRIELLLCLGSSNILLDLSVLILSQK